MPVHMIELEEVQMIEVGDEALEAMKAVAGTNSYPFRADPVFCAIKL